MENNKIILSIIIPVYNVEQYIEQCIKSILTQCDDRIEIIIVNDGTPDNSISIIEKLTKDNPHFRIINQENQGLSVARNTGLSKASGEYVWFIDSDDWILEDAISVVLGTVVKHRDVEVFSSIMKRYYEKDHTYGYKPHKGKLEYSGFEYLLAKQPIGAAVRFIYKRSFLLQNNLKFEPNILHEDALWGFSMLYLANKILFFNVPLYVYRIRESHSIMSSIKIKSAYDLLKGHQILKNFMVDHVKEEDKVKYRVLIFGMIKSLLNFTKHISNSVEYKEFMDIYRGYIRIEALWVFKQSWNIQPLLIFFSPLLFSQLCKLK